MTAPHSLFAPIVALLLCVLSVLAFTYVRRARGLAGMADLDTLLDRLEGVDRHKLAQVATDLRSPDPCAELEAWQVWDLIGGMNGLQALEGNCRVLIDLACYVQRWYPETLPVAEQLRLHAREVQWHLERLRGAEVRGNLEIAFPDYAQRAAAIYYEMTKSVLTLFEASRVPGYARLQAVL